MGYQGWWYLYFWFILVCSRLIWLFYVYIKSVEGKDIVCVCVSLFPSLFWPVCQCIPQRNQIEAFFFAHICWRKTKVKFWFTSICFFSEIFCANEKREREWGLCIWQGKKLQKLDWYRFFFEVFYFWKIEEGVNVGGLEIGSGAEKVERNLKWKRKVEVGWNEGDF